MNPRETIIRPEEPADLAAIRLVHESAFPTSAEADLVDNLRRAGRLSMSLVALCDGAVAGHIGLSPATVAGKTTSGWGLAPVAVRPEFQRTGIGSQLIHAGLTACTFRQVGFVVVLGSPAYYGRFGFLPASRWKLLDEYGGGEAFQALEIVPGAIPNTGGLVQYSPEFAVFGS